MPAPSGCRRGRRPSSSRCGPCGVGEWDEVITTAHTFIATAEAISNVGAVPVFADIDPATFNIDPNHVEDLVTERTKAILAVHLYGRPADLTSLMAIAERHGLWLVEDAAQAHGAEIDGRRCGSIGHLACFSFYPGKNLGAYGDAGAITGNDSAVLDRIRMLRDHGRTTQVRARRDRLRRADRRPPGGDPRRQAAAPRGLDRGPPAARGLLHPPARERRTSSFPSRPTASEHVYHLYVIRSSTRDGLLDHLKGAGIGAGIHYPIPLHRQPAYTKRGYGPVSLPHTERAAAEVLSLPIYPELSDEQQQAVVDAVGSFHG